MEIIFELLLSIKSRERMKKDRMIGLGIAFGTAFGAGIGAATDNLALWISLGIAIGAALGFALQNKAQAHESDSHTDDSSIE